MQMKPVIVMPMNDPEGVMFPHLLRILPDLKELFENAVLSIPPETQQKQASQIMSLASDSFIEVLYLEKGQSVGEEFNSLYTYATKVCHPDQTMHLCYPDRVSFALQNRYRSHFMTDIRRLAAAETPLIFQRSPKAWHTHPGNYIKLENMVTTLGEVLFGQTLDFAWCHLAVQGKTLAKVMPNVTHPSIAMVAEIILLLRRQIHSREVDWLAWEDPFILNRDASILKAEREGSFAETQKRLNYVIPMMQLLQHAYEFENI